MPTVSLYNFITACLLSSEITVHTKRTSILKFQEVFFVDSKNCLAGARNVSIDFKYDVPCIENFVYSSPASLLRSKGQNYVIKVRVVWSTINRVLLHSMIIKQDAR